MNEHNQSIFPNYQGNFFNFHKRVGDTSPLLPANCAPVRHQTYTCILKIIGSTSQKHFNNSIKIAAESLLSPAIRSFTHVHIDKHHKNPQTILKNKEKNNPHNFIINKLAFDIFVVVPNFAKILTTVKIVKKLMQAKKV